MLLSFTIPCYKSEYTIKAVIDEIISMVHELGNCDYEIIAVNDASPDGTWQVLTALSRTNPRIRAVDLAKNVGKHAALMAAFSMVSGDVVIGVDDDGQCPLNELARLLAPLEDGYDMSMASYPKKKQSIFKNFGSRINDYMVRFLIGKPKGMTFSNFIARKRFVCEEIIKYENPYPYLRKAKLVLITSDWEGYGLVAAEALSLHVPVLACAVGGLCTIFQNVPDALCHSEEELFLKTRSLLTSQKCYEKYCRKLQKFVHLQEIMQYKNLLGQIYSEEITCCM